MPRGVYDRSKVKSKDAEVKAPKAAKAVKVKKEAAPKLAKQAKAVRQSKSIDAAPEAVGGQQLSQALTAVEPRMWELRNAVSLLTGARQVVTSTHAHVDESVVRLLDETLTKVITEYSETLFPKKFVTIVGTDQSGAQVTENIPAKIEVVREKPVKVKAAKAEKIEKVEEAVPAPAPVFASVPAPAPVANGAAIAPAPLPAPVAQAPVAFNPPQA